MELSIPVKDVTPQYIFFAEKRKNVIVDGNFVKIIYSTPRFEMNGLYIYLELDLLHSPTKLPSSENPSIPVLILRSGHEVVGIQGFASEAQRSEYRKSNVNDSEFTRNVDFYDVKRKEIAPLLKISDLPSSYSKSVNFIKSGDFAFSMYEESRRSMFLNANSENNIYVIDRLCKVEQEIVDRYIECHCPAKSASYILKTQLLSGIIKYNSENKTPVSAHPPKNSSKPGKYILKISGVWETATNVGITMKFILLG